MDVSYFFRKPKFPVICVVDGYVIAAKSRISFEKQLSAIKNLKEDGIPIVDISGEGWSYHPEHMVVSPLTTKKKWYKSEVIAIFNKRKNNKSNIIYSEKSIASKRFERIFKEIVELILKNP